MHGEAALAEGFPHFPYVNPEAPKGGRITLGVQGSFDSLNPFIVRGEPVQGMREFVFESLMARSQDEPFTLYALLAESIDVTNDRSEVTFTLDPRARFSDGKPVTADDVIFSFEVLRDKGRPNYRTYFKKVAEARKVSDRVVHFRLSDADFELPLILSVMPVMAKHALSAETFDATTLTPPVGSGPYRVGTIETGRAITYRARPELLGPRSSRHPRPLQLRRNPLRLLPRCHDPIRKPSSPGLIDVRNEDDPGNWAQGYRFPAVDDGRVIKEAHPIGLPSGMTGLVFNTRRPVFADPDVRARAHPVVQLRMGQQDAFCRPLQTHAKLLRAVDALIRRQARRRPRTRPAEAVRRRREARGARRHL